ncbi:MAG TPA: hypothetical protein VL984_18390 [Acidimicrobiales bacterium]|nr:hypothetical protein [Acidimicrobiales bacterium]
MPETATTPIRTGVIGATTTTTTTAFTGVEVDPPLRSAQGTLTTEERVEELRERARLTDKAGFLRNDTASLSERAADIHHVSFSVQLDTMTTRLATQSPVRLLDELGDLGFAWRDIARMVGVSVPALRRWRAGERPTGDNRREIAQLLAFVKIIVDHGFVFEPASWMEMPVSSAIATTAIDLYSEGQLEIVFDLATHNITAEQALDLIEPDWRTSEESNWEVLVAEDGAPYIRPKHDGA